MTAIDRLFSITGLGWPLADPRVLLTKELGPGPGRGSGTASATKIQARLDQTASSLTGGRFPWWQDTLIASGKRVLAERPAKLGPSGAQAYNLQLDAPVEVKKNLGTALAKLSDGKVRSLEQLQAHQGPDRVRLEGRLNQAVTQASSGQLKTYEALLERAQGKGAPGKPGYNPAAALTYAVTGTAVAYNILRSNGLSAKDAAMKLPGSFSRSLITASIAQVPTNIKDPYL